MTETVSFNARCDGDCGGDARWNGVKREGGCTDYVINCAACGIAPARGNIEPACVVETREPQYVPEYIRRFIGRRSA